ncbi:hypothetical protein SLA2020_446890 [Shorea laevis]
MADDPRFAQLNEQFAQLTNTMTTMQEKMLTRADLQEILEESQAALFKKFEEMFALHYRNRDHPVQRGNHGHKFCAIKISPHDVQPEQTRTESEGAANEQSKKAEEVIVDQTEKFQKLRAECDLTKQKIKNDDVLVQEFVKEKSDDDWPYYDAEQLFDEKLKSVPAQKEFTKSVPVLIMKKLELLRGMFWHYASVFFLWRIFWERSMYMKLDYLKYLVGLRHRWRWKYRCQLLLAQDPSSNHTVEVRLQVDEPKQAKKSMAEVQVLQDSKATWQ